MSEPEAHIAAWEAAGLIDAETATRLRAASIASPDAAQATSAAAPSAPAATRSSTVGAVFGPAVSVGEMFGYLGAAFILAAWTSFAARTLGPADSEFGLGVGALAAAAALVLLARRLSTIAPRERRAAGAAYLVAVSCVAVAATAFLTGRNYGWPESAVIAGIVALGAAIAVRRLHPALLTQVALLASATGLAGALLAWIETVIDGSPTQDLSTGTVGGSWPGGVDPIVLVIGSALWWLGLAVIIGIVGLREAQGDAADSAAGRRAALSRLWAGLVAVFGLASAVTRSEITTDYAYVRTLAPWIGEFAILVLCLVLVERAFRRGAATFVYAAGIGLVIALTDLNVSYLSGTTEVALLIEGLILVGAGVAADRLRRQVGHPDVGSPPPVPAAG